MDKTLPEIISQFAERPRSLVAATFKKNKLWIKWSWEEYLSNIESVFGFLKSKGIAHGDRVAIFANSSIEWALCDLACQCMGAVTVPIYQNCSEEDLIHILNETNPKLIFVEDGFTEKRLPKSHLSEIVLFHEDPRSRSEKKEFFWPSINDSAINTPVTRQDFLSSCLKISPKTLATIVFTSGTSGVPKGVCLNQRQIVSELKDLTAVFPITSKDVTLSFLPYAHILGRVEMWLSSYAGFTLAFAEGVEQIKKNLIEIKPTVLIAVPRIFEKIHASVLANLNGLTVQQIIRRFESKGFLGSLSMAPLRLLLQDRIRKKLRESLGGQLKYAISGGAPLSKEISGFFRDCDILLLEGYGLTETTGAVCVNTPSEYHFGTVGKPLPDVEIKLKDDGEILVRSHKVFAGFLNPELDGGKDLEGFYATGDIGEWTPEGFLRITDRKKDLIKTSGGKYVAPQKIESLFKKYPLISHVLVFGDQRKYIVALLTLDLEELKNLAAVKSIPFSKTTDLIYAPGVSTEVEEIVKSVNSELAGFETIKKFGVLDEELSIAKGELTPSLKVRRKFCEKKYRDEIDKLYGI